MIRSALVMSAMLIGTASTWQRHVPEAVQAQAPVLVQDILLAVDDATAQGTAYVLSQLGQEAMPSRERAAGLPGFGFDRGNRTGTPATVSSEGDIRVVVETVSSAALRTGQFDRTAFLGARLDKAEFMGARMAGVHLDGAVMPKALFSETSLKGATGRTAQFEGAVFHRTDMTEARFEGANLKGAIFTGTTLVNARLDSIDAREALFRFGTASGTSFAKSHLTGVRFVGMDLREASFAGADLTGAHLTDSRLHRADFHGAKLGDADLSGAEGLSSFQLEGACGNARTRLPAGLIVPSCTTALALEDEAPQQLASLP